MRKKANYSRATLLYGTTAYCDQWNHIMAVYDMHNHLRGVVAESDGINSYDVLLIGDDGQMLYQVFDVELGSTSKNMSSCFNLFLELRHVETPTFLYCKENKGVIEAYQMFTHTRSACCKHGGFRVIPDAEDKISVAKRALAKAISELPVVVVEPDKSRYNNRRRAFCSDFDEYLYGLTGGDPQEKMFIMSGVFDD